MPSLRRKILVGALVFDAVLAIMFLTVSPSGLTAWTFLNIIAIFFALLIWMALSPRRRGGRRIFSVGAREEYGSLCITLNGETVKSKGEKRIADYFHQNNIRYEYETSAWTNGRYRDRIISRPDFYLPDFDVFVEYWGVVNVDDGRKREEYVRNMKWKMAQYHDNDIKFVSLYPDNLHNLDWVFKAKLREATGIDLRKQ